MNNLSRLTTQFSISFIKDEEGAQVVEYALIIAVVSIGLVLALAGPTSLSDKFATFVTRVGNCLAGTAGC